MADSQSIIVARIRGGVRDWINDYIRRRHAAPLAGEFLDEDGARNAQFGIGGTCFVASIEAEEGLVPARFQSAWTVLQNGLTSAESDRTADERHLLKDVPRISNKSILLALAPQGTLDPTPIIEQVFANRGANGLVRLVIDDPHADGDAVVTAMVILMLRFGRRDRAFMTQIHATLPELRRQVEQGDLQLLERLFVSTAVCVFDFASSIDMHRRLLSKLYASDLDWHRAFSSNSPFLDHRYGDTAAPAPARARNRYLRIPEGFVIMAAIYITIGDERRFFTFPAVRALLKEFRMPFSAHVGRDKNKASAYFAWFTYAALHPERFLATPRQHPVIVNLARLSYYRSDLTFTGMLVLAVFLLGTGGVAWFAVELARKGVESELDKFIGAVGTAVGALLGMFRTRKR